ncbi:hypothetical protein ACPV3S_19915 [Photobacterium damselae]|uniref:hypothetical protein n=1 Tax=Photobacterium damselae TaxID=38293 RepID=UPI004069653D
MEKNKFSEITILLIIPLIALFDVNLFISKITVWICIFLFFVSLFFLDAKIRLTYISCLFLLLSFILLSSNISVYNFVDFDLKVIVRCIKLIVIVMYIYIAYCIVCQIDVSKLNFYLKIIYNFSLLHILFLIWQFIANRYGFYFPDVGLTIIHGVSNSISNFIGIRLTGIANEPSYMARILIQMLLLSIYFKKYLMSILIFVLGVLTFSMSYYVCLFLILLALVVLKGYTRLILIFSVLVLCIFIVEPFLITFISERLLTETSGESARSHDLIKAPLLFINSCNIVTCMIGYGQDAIPRLNSQNILIYDTTNNYYVDSLIENGFIYVSLLFSFFVFVFFKIKRMTFSFSFFMLLTLGLMFRNDVLTFGFASVAVIVMMLFVLEKNDKRVDLI